MSHKLRSQDCPMAPQLTQVIAEVRVLLQLGVFEAVAAEEDVGAPGGGGEAAQGHNQGAVHPLLLAAGDPLEHRPIPAVLRLAQDYHCQVIHVFDVPCKSTNGLLFHATIGTFLAN